ncbi:MAG: phage tail tape measure protein [Lachnospiraceae bacterium]|nr:phage tail tape measure protein [Lachnospiraceae bacterium]
MSDIKTTLSLNDQVSSKLRTIGQAAQTASKNMQDVGKAIDKAFSGTGVDKFSSSMTRSVGSAAQSMSGFTQSVGEAAQTAQNFQQTVSSSLSGAQSGMSSFGNTAASSMDSAADAMDDMADAAKSAGEAVGQIGSDSGNIAGVGTEASKAGSEVSNLNEKTNTLGETFKKLAGIVGGLAIANKIKQYGEDSLESYKSFESGMAEVNSLLPDATKAQMDELGEGAREIAKSTGAEISDVTSAMYQAISASVPQDQVLGFLETAEKAATGGVSDMETAVDAITSVTNAYGTDTISATEASDKMFSAVKRGKTTFDELAGSLYNVVPTAVGAGVSFDDITGALAAMTAQGVPTSVATTQLRQAIVELSDSGSNTGKKFKELAGTGFRDFIAQGHNLSDAFQIMQAEADKTGVGVNELFSSVEAGNAVLSLSGEHADLFANDIAAMQDSAGATDTAYGKMTDTLEHRTDVLKAQFEDIKTSAGEALAGGIDAISQYISDNTEGIRTTVVEFFKGVGDLMGKLAPMIPGILKGLTGIASGFTKAITPILDFATTHPEFIETALGAITAAVTTFKFADMDWSKSGIGKMLSFITANPTIAGITASAAGITALGIAIDKYNEKQIDNNLEAHFGNVSLSGEAAKDAAVRILNPGSESIDNPIDVLTTLNEANDLVAQAKQLKDDADEALRRNSTIEWEAHITGGLSEDDKTAFIQNVNTFIESTKQSALTQAQGVSESISTLIGGETGAALVTAVNNYSTEDFGTMDSLSAAIQGMAEDAVNEGLQNVNINAALSIAQAKLAQFNAGLREAELKSNMDYLGIEYSGAALDKDSWSKVVEEMGNYQKDYDTSSSESEKAILSYFEQEAALGHTDQNGVFEGTNWTMDDITEMVRQAREHRGQTFQQLSQDWMNKSLSDAYGEEISGADMQGEAQKRLDQILSTAQAGGDAFSTAETVGGTMNWNLDNATSGALADRYAQMAPNVEEMQKTIDQAREAGEAVPQAYMDAYNKAIEIGAAGGDTNAGYQYMANQLAEAGQSQEFLDQIDKAGAVIPQEFRDAIDRSMTQTSTEDYSGFYDTFMKGITGEIDWSEVESEFQKYGLTLGEDFWQNGVQEGAPQSADEVAKYLNLDGLTTAGQTETTAGGETSVKYTLDADVQTVWSVAGKVIEAGGGGGLSQSDLVNEILTANGWTNEDAQHLDVGQEIKIPQKYVIDPQVDTSGAAGAAQEAASAGQAAADSASGGTATVHTTTNISADGNVTNAGEVAEQAQTQVQGELDNGMENTGTSNITMSETDNAGEVYNNVKSNLESQFASGISIGAHATVNMSWGITNASKTITLDGASGGSFTITAHKFGGYFTEPHIGMVAEAGPEWVIPDNGSAESAEMLMEAAQSIIGSGDITGNSGKVMPDMASYLGQAGGASGGKSEKEITININGSGSISASGMSREQVVEVLEENLRPVLLNIVSTEDAEEGMLAYEY